MNSNYYKSFGLAKADKDYLKKQEIYNIYKKPKKDKRGETPRFYNFQDNNAHQIDILYMPTDHGYKYMVVVVDIGSRKTDAEPLKKIDSTEVLNAVLRIYKRGILKEPEKITIDSGSEFKGEFEKEMGRKGIIMKVALTGRHRQVGIVEKYNGIIARVLFMRMASEEVLTGEPSTEWVEDLPGVIKAMNKKYGRSPLTEKDLLRQFNPDEELKQKIIPLNTWVRIQLDEPKNITGEKLHGKFRATDHRWSLEKYRVVNYVFDPIEPVLYQLSGQKLSPNQHVAYTRNQLQIVDTTEEDPPYKDVVRGNKKQELYIIREILDRKKLKGKTQYLIWWKGFPKSDASWEDANNIPKEQIKKFDDNDN
jgi:hypothetical protein